MKLTDDNDGGCGLFDLILLLIFGMAGVTCEETTDDDDD